MATKLETIYQEASLKDVFDFFVKNYKLPDGNSIVAHEVFFDVYKQKIICKLIVRKATTCSSADSASAVSSNPSPSCQPQSFPES